jgi:ribosome-associated toxin RatA of RatAB toxin-antitoxin module
MDDLYDGKVDVFSVQVVRKNNVAEIMAKVIVKLKRVNSRFLCRNNMAEIHGLVIVELYE